MPRVTRHSFHECCLISAGEASGDQHAAELLRALQSLRPGTLTAFGMGGEHLQAAGLESVVGGRGQAKSSALLAVMGSTEVFGALPRIFRALEALEKAARERRPDFAVLVDYPEFHFRLAKRLKKLHIPVFCYIPPKTWIWRTGRVRFLQRYFQHLFCIFPFEVAFYQKLGLSKVTYVGNPLVDELDLARTRAEAQASLASLPQPSAQCRWVVLMAGSRPAELKAHLEVMVAAVAGAMGKLQQEAVVLLPFATRAQQQAALPAIQRLQERYQATVRLVPSVGNAADCLRAAECGLIKSGTATLEAGVLDLPHCVVYRPSRLTGWLFRHLVRYRGPVGLVNLAVNGPHLVAVTTLPKTAGVSSQALLPGQGLGLPAIPEILMHEVTEARLTGELIQLLESEPARARQREYFQTLRLALLQVPPQAGEERGSPSLFLATQVLAKAAEVRWQTGSQGVKKGPAVATLVGSFLWSSASWWVRWLLSRGVLKGKVLPGVGRVVSVGNLQSGGSGKTPLVAKIACEAAARGLQVIILTRGFGGVWGRSGRWGRAWWAGSNVDDACGGLLGPGLPEVSPQLAGDEPVLLHQLCPQAVVAVGADRVRQFHQAVRFLATRSLGGQSPRIDLVILDDGLQHWRIHKDLEVVALTHAQRGGRRSGCVGKVLFRDFYSVLRYCQLVVWTQVGVASELREAVQPFIGDTPQLQAYTRLAAASQMTRPELPLWLVLGIAQPQRVVDFLDALGCTIAQTVFLPDHAPVTRSQIAQWCEAAERVGARVTVSGKDWVKWEEQGAVRARVWVIEPELYFQEEEAVAVWERLLWGELGCEPGDGGGEDVQVKTFDEKLPHSATAIAESASSAQGHRAPDALRHNEGEGGNNCGQWTGERRR